MNLHDRYMNAINEHGFTADAAQLKSIKTLERVQGELLAATHKSNPLADLLRSLRGNNQTSPVHGAYLWGGVGRGKTFVMDLFYENLPFEDKLRQHFHRLMYHVHSQLKRLGHQQDPLETIADDLARRARVICFDEFFVADIADAMLLGGLLQALFEEGVTLVATSNVAPGINA